MIPIFIPIKGSLIPLPSVFQKKIRYRQYDILCILAAVFVYGIYTLRGKYAWSAGIVLTVAGVFIVFTKRKAVVYGIRFVSYLYKNRMAAYMHTVKPSIQIWENDPTGCFLVRNADRFSFAVICSNLCALYAQQRLFVIV